MSMRQFTRLINAFSKKVENHEHSVAIHYTHYNFCRIHQTLCATPAMEAGITDHVWELEEIVALILRLRFGLLVHMKLVPYIIVYIVLLIPSLMVALDKFVAIVFDPPVVNPNINTAFWLSWFGECLWFGVAFILPALVLFAFHFAANTFGRKLKRIQPLGINAARNSN